MLAAACYFSLPQTDTAQATSPCNENTVFVEMNESTVSPFADQTIKKRNFEEKLCRWIKCQVGNTQRAGNVLIRTYCLYLQDTVKELQPVF